MSSLAEQLCSDDYARQRLSPSPGDHYYLSLLDLLHGIREVRGLLPRGKYLDFGCGGSPYRSLFDATSYHRADLPGTRDLDFCFGQDSRLPVDAGSYDVVLSTQVLEHVPDHRAYLAECARVLRRGGRLLVTTHGGFPEHACPHDYRRWTPDGLALELAGAGLKPLRSLKLTTGARALLFHLRLFQHTLLGPGWSPGAILLRLLRAPFRHRPAAMDRLADAMFPGQGVVEALPGSADLYVGILIVAEKAAAAP